MSLACTDNHIPQNTVMCNNLFKSLTTNGRLTSCPNGYTRRNNNVIITSKRRCGAVWTKQWYYHYVPCMLRYCILCPVYEDPIFNGATGCDNLSMPTLKLIHICKTGPWRSSEDIMAWTGNHISHIRMMCNQLFTPLILHSCLTSYPNRHTWPINNVIITSKRHRGVVSV